MAPFAHDRLVRTLLFSAFLWSVGTAQAADAARGAQLYMRTDGDTRSCVACHGPDPGQSHNNILRAADNPDTLTKVLNTVSAMGFLRSQLSDTDRADIAAFLGTITRLGAVDAPLRLWPVTMDFGTVPVGLASAQQTVRIVNTSATASLTLPALTATGANVDLAHDCPAALPPAGACDVRARLTAPAAGLQRGALEVRAQGAATPFYIGLAASGTSGPTSALAWPPGAAVLSFNDGGAPPVLRQSIRLHNPGPMPAVLGTASIVGTDAARFRIEQGCAQGQVLVAQTGCEMVVSYSPSLKPTAEAALQVRSDQANPASIRLEGRSGTAPVALPDNPVAVGTDSGGGCSVGPPGRKAADPTLALAALLAALASARRFGRRGPGKRLLPQATLARQMHLVQRDLSHFRLAGFDVRPQ